MFLLLLACATPEAGTCADWPAAASAPDGVVEDSCGYWTRAVGEHLYANVYVVEEQAACEVDLDAGLSLFADPIYSAMSDDAPKWTLDVVAEAAGTALLVDVVCADGTLWQAKIDVE